MFGTSWLAPLTIKTKIVQKQFVALVQFEIRKTVTKGCVYCCAAMVARVEFLIDFRRLGDNNCDKCYQTVLLDDCLSHWLIFYLLIKDNLIMFYFQIHARKLYLLVLLFTYTTIWRTKEDKKPVIMKLHNSTKKTVIMKLHNSTMGLHNSFTEFHKSIMEVHNMNYGAP